MCCLVVSGAERDTLDCCRNSDSSPFQRNSQSSSIKQFKEMVHMLVIGNRDEECLISHVTLQSAHILPIKTAINTFKLLQIVK